MTELSDLVEAFKREVAVPGQFEASFPGVTDADVVGLLGDGFSEAQLNRLFPRHVLDLDAEVISPDLSLAGARLVVLFAALNLVRTNWSWNSNSTAYRAGPVSAEESSSSNVVTTLFKSLQERLDRILRNVDGVGSVLPFVLDGYRGRASASSYGVLSASERGGSVFGVELGGGFVG